MLHLLLAILVGLLSYAIVGLFASRNVAVIAGLIVGIWFYFSGGWGM